jgi:hypothetical protein
MAAYLKEGVASHGDEHVHPGVELVGHLIPCTC